MECLGTIDHSRSRPVRFTVFRLDFLISVGDFLGRGHSCCWDTFGHWSSTSKGPMLVTVVKSLHPRFTPAKNTYWQDPSTLVSLKTMGSPRIVVRSFPSLRILNVCRPASEPADFVISNRPKNARWPWWPLFATRFKCLFYKATKGGHIPAPSKGCQLN